MYDPNVTNNVPTYKVEDVVIHIETNNSFRLRKSNWSEFWKSITSKPNSTIVAPIRISFVIFIRIKKITSCLYTDSVILQYHDEKRYIFFFK